ncbi:permease [Halorhodospira halochloris]|nr:permease [Halorhodospira halochloris]MCG5529659.1 permease [Halorhodospira halochloris]
MRQNLDGMTIFFLILAICTGVGVYIMEGAGVWIEAISSAGGLLVQIGPIVIAAVMISGYVQTLVPNDKIEYWLGNDAGWRGLGIAIIAGAITPGGPFAAFPLVVALYRMGAAFEILVAYLTAWSVLGINRAMVWEVPFFGIEFVGLKMLVSLPLPILAALMAKSLRRYVTASA